MLGGQQQEQDKVERVAVAAGTSESSLPVIDVTARAMQRQFADNEVSAKALYEGKRARVTGTLASIDLDFSDDPMLILETGEMFNRVQASFDKADATAIGQLRKGTKVTVLCDRVSEVVGSPMLNDCALVK